jgi:hypothetical protein
MPFGLPAVLATPARERRLAQPGPAAKELIDLELEELDLDGDLRGLVRTLRE